MTVWLDGVVEPLCGAVNCDAILMHLRACLFSHLQVIIIMFPPGKQAFDYCVFIFARGKISLIIFSPSPAITEISNSKENV